MLIGSKENFAIEAFLKQRTDYIFIHYCFWVRNQMIGDLEEATLLTAVIPILKTNLALQGQRRFPDLQGMRASEVLDYLTSKLWLLPSSKEYLLPYNEQDLKRTNINSYEGESFQGFFTFLIECDGYDWLLCQETGVEKVFDVKIPKSDLYLKIKQLMNWIDQSTVLTLRPEPTNQS